MFLSEKQQNVKAAEHLECGKKTEYCAAFKKRNRRDYELYTDHFNLNSQEIL